MAQQPVKLVDSRMVDNFVSSWEDLNVNNVGEMIIFTIQGTPSLYDVKKSDGSTALSYRNDGSTFKKMIFNVKHKSMLALKSPFVLANADKGLAAETAGDKIGAHEHFNRFLRSVQISFSLPIEHRLAYALKEGDTILGKAELRVTKNGQLLSIDPSTVRIFIPVPVITGKTAFKMRGGVQGASVSGVVPPTTPNIFGNKPANGPMETIDEDGVILETADMNFEQLIVRAKGLMIGTKGKDAELLRKLITEKELELLLDNEEDATPLAATGTDGVAETLEP